MAECAPLFRPTLAVTETQGGGAKSDQGSQSERGHAGDVTGSRWYSATGAVAAWGCSPGSRDKTRRQASGPEGFEVRPAPLGFSATTAVRLPNRCRGP